MTRFRADGLLQAGQVDVQLAAVVGTSQAAVAERDAEAARAALREELRWALALLGAL
jgi:hypothetical protein